MTIYAFSEYVGGRVLTVEDLDPGTLQPVGGTTLVGPAGLAVHPNGDVLVAELGADRLALAPSGQAWERFGSTGAGTGHFRRPTAAAWWDGQLLVLDSGNGRLVLMDDILGGGWTSYGHPGRPTALDPAQDAFADPRGLAIDASGRIWVADPGAGRVIRVDNPTGSGWTQFVTGPSPYGLSAVGDGVAVIDATDRTVRILDATGAVTAALDLTSWASPTFAAYADDALLVADVRANAMCLLADDGTVVAELRGSPPDLVQPLFDSVGGVTS